MPLELVPDVKAALAAGYSVQIHDNQYLTVKRCAGGAWVRFTPRFSPGDAGLLVADLLTKQHGRDKGLAELVRACGDQYVC